MFEIGSPRHYRNRLRGILRFYREVRTFPVLARRFRVRRVGLRVPTRMVAMNPSIIATPDGWITTVRTHNWPEVGSEGHALRNETWLVRLSEDLVQQDARPLAAELPRLPGGTLAQAQTLALNGLEDIRLFRKGEDLCFLAVATNFPELRNTMVLGRVVGDSLTDGEFLPSPFGLDREKNWMPVVTEEGLQAVYQTQPLTLLQLERQPRVVLQHERNAGFHMWSGSSQLLPYQGGWLGLVHKRKVIMRGWAYYVHALVHFASDWTVVAHSDPFFIERPGLEFCAGLAVKGDRFVLSYGRGDVRAMLMELDHAAIAALLNENRIAHRPERRAAAARVPELALR